MTRRMLAGFCLGFLGISLNTAQGDDAKPVLPPITQALYRGAARSDDIRPVVLRAMTESPSAVKETQEPELIPLPRREADAPVLQEPIWDVFGRRIHIDAGGGVYVVQPYFKTNPAYAIRTTTFGPPSQTNATQFNFRQSLEAAPTAWINVSGENGLGMRFRYFQYSQATGFLITTAAGPAGGIQLYYTPYPQGLGITNGFNSVAGDTFRIVSGLKIETYDVESTRSLFGETWEMTGGLGARIVYQAQDYIARYAPGPNNGFANFQNLFAGHAFTGAGPMVSIDAAHDLGMTGFQVFCSARGAILFGHVRESALHQVISQAGALVVSDTAGTFQDDVLPTGDLEIGLRLNRQITNAMRLHLQIGVASQMWWGAGNAANSDSILGTSFPDETGSGNANMGLLGLVFRAGIDY